MVKRRLTKKIKTLLFLSIYLPVVNGKREVYQGNKNNIVPVTRKLPIYLLVMKGKRKPNQRNKNNIVPITRKLSICLSIYPSVYIYLCAHVRACVRACVRVFTYILKNLLFISHMPSTPFQTAQAVNLTGLNLLSS